MKHKQGFNLIELSMVMIVVGVIAMALLTWTPTTVIETITAEGFANTFYQDLNYTKVLSISENQRYRIVVGASDYQIQDQNGTPVPNLQTGQNSTPYPAGLTITPTTTLMFDSIGRPYDGGGSPLGSTLTFTVSVAGQTKSVSVIPQTGLVQ
ncbi:GspH/FimT family pseudopilin [Legionella yabuuchiae]|uniref:GspH/FimT family pseudopilin n=1 Tax=Legionella yabuuchiae TaxID=376727 RepID=UPI0013EFBDAF|nr:prepilin-type N-terminal cleavage/methylation domain-containing protein [Legionella yabuuchiae]